MLARRLTTIVPAMRLADALETTRIHRVAGLTGARTAMVTTRPCRAPAINNTLEVDHAKVKRALSQI
jgi:predicted ATPase with chaperone activity